MRAVSLFSGAGGFEIGLERAGIQTVLQAENDPWCLSVLERHWPEVTRVDDVRSVGCEREPTSRGTADGVLAPVDLGRRETGPGLSERIDLVYGGFPCQDLSVAGARAGFRGERSSLWFEFQRVLSELRPRWALIENVPGLLSSDGGRDMATVLGGLGDLGYGWAYRVLDARWFGVPQRRRRVFIVGCLGDAARAAAVLAVCESCGGHPAQGRETWEDVAPTLDDGARRSSVELPMIVDEQNAAAVAEVGALSSGSAHGNRGFSVAATLSSDGHPESNLPGRHHEDDDNLVVARSLTARNERIDAETENLVLAGSDTASQGHHGHSSPRGDGADNLVYALRRDAEQSGEAKTLSRDASGNMRLRDPGFNVYTDAPTVDATGPHTIGPVAGFYSHRGQNHDTAYTEDGCPPILGSQTAPGVNGPMGVRRLTPLECERLQGWPDEHTRWTADGKEIKDSHRYRLIGNGVASPVAEYIAHRLVEADRWP